MSKLGEYLKLAKEGIPNIDKIAEGLLNQAKDKFGRLLEDEHEEIVRRQLICHSCPFFSLNLFNNDEEYQKLYNKKFESDRTSGKFCGICGCPEITKTSSLSSDCGLSSYNEEHPENIQELKWTKYK